MKTYMECVKCGECDDKHAKTGATIDGKYHCEGCYSAAMDVSETQAIKQVFGAQAGKGGAGK